MPRRKSANEMSDREIMEKVFNKRVVRELEQEYELRSDENDSDTDSTLSKKQDS